jgi:hypothetical protein
MSGPVVLCEHCIDRAPLPAAFELEPEPYRRELGAACGEHQ